MMFVKTIIAFSLVILAVAAPSPQPQDDPLGGLVGRGGLPLVGDLLDGALLGAIDVIDSRSSALEVSTSALSGS
ncbi:hypothetical protein BJV78DRAFT_1286330 [Lactifluus subvellereus]|nr:hypothetical protein BJV78DRAFT_1286330 [Lactifluus subvellereus]